MRTWLAGADSPRRRCPRGTTRFWSCRTPRGPFHAWRRGCRACCSP